MKSILRSIWHQLRTIYRDIKNPIVGDILMLHRVTSKGTSLQKNKALEITPNQFEKIILSYKQRNYQFVSLDEFINIKRTKSFFQNQKYVTITFDDGYKDNLVEALPICQKYSVPFTIYVSTSMLTRTAFLWWYVLEEILMSNTEIKLGNEICVIKSLDEKNAMFDKIHAILSQRDTNECQQWFDEMGFEWNEINQRLNNQLCLSNDDLILLGKEKLCTIGSHTVSHARLTKQLPDMCFEELSNSKKYLEAIIEKPILHFSYPYGDVNTEVIADVQACGYLSAVIIQEGCVRKNDNVLELHRVRTIATPLVSIIVPIYNVEQYLKECLDSLVNQTLQDIEIICVNDGSPDNSADVVRKYMQADSRIKLIEQENRGLSGARNAGLKVAKGEYVYFMDSDDWLEHDAMDVCYQKAIRGNVDVVLFDALSFVDGVEKYSEEIQNDYDRSKLLQSYANQAMPAKQLFKQMIQSGAMRASACLNFIRRDLLVKNDLNFEEGLIHEDELFTPQLYALASTMTYIPRVFFHRRVRQGSIMTTRKVEQEVETYDFIIKQLWDVAKQYNCVNRYIVLKRLFLLSTYVTKIAEINNYGVERLSFEYRIIRLIKGLNKLQKICSTEFLRFCFVGLIATGIHYGLYYILMNICHLWMNVAYTIGFLVSFGCNFLLSNYFTFHTKPDFGKLIGMTGAHLVNYLNHIILLNAFVWLGLSENIAPLLVYMIAIPINFIMVRFVFKYKLKKNGKE